PSRLASTRTRLRTDSVSPVAADDSPATTPVGARYSPKRLRSASAHSPVVTPAWAARIETGIALWPDTIASSSARSALVTSRARPRAKGARDSARVPPGGASAQGVRPPRRERRRLRLLVGIHPDDGALAALDLAQAPRVRSDELLLHVGALDGCDGAAHLRDA